MKKSIDPKPVTEVRLIEILDKKEEILIKILDKKFDSKFEEWSKDVLLGIHNLFYSKFEENDKRITELDKKLDEKFDKVMIGQDKIIGMLETWEIENTVGTDQISELRLDVDDHNKRLKVLESAKN